MERIDFVLREMRERTVQQKENIDDFYQNNKATATDLYRAEYYAGLVKKQADLLDHYLQELAKTGKKDAKEQERANNNVRLQAKILQVTYEAFTEQLNALTQKTDLQIIINSKIEEQKQRLKDLLDKAQKIIKPQDNLDHKIY